MQVTSREEVASGCETCSEGLLSCPLVESKRHGYTVSPMSLLYQAVSIPLRVPAVPDLSCTETTYHLWMTAAAP